MSNSPSSSAAIHLDAESAIPAGPSSAEIEAVRRIAEAAGAEILAVYEANDADSLQVDYKGDDSPLTEADRRAHQLICAELARLTPDLPVLSEESDKIPFSQRTQWERYWLVDPLDGTKEFIGRNGEFTVNIALIDQGAPVAGVVHVPVSGVSYCAGNEQGRRYSSPADRDGRELRVQQMTDGAGPRVVASRRHRGEHVDRLLGLLAEQVAEPSVVSMGSSLKMCLLAEGSADFYPRLAPTSEWDTAAAHAVLRSAGGEIVGLDWQPLRYNQKDSLLNPFFVALADQHFGWRELTGDILNTSLES